MNRTHLHRSLAAVVTVVACLALMATPAAAPPHNGTFTGGVITFTKTGVSETISLTPVTTSCTDAIFSADIITTSTPHLIGFTALDFSHVVHISTSSSYLMVLTRSTVGNSAGEINSTTTSTHPINSLTVGITASFYNTTTCTPTATLLCRLGIILHLSGSSTSATASNTFSLTGTAIANTVAFPTCTAGPSQLLGTIANTTTPLTGHITT